MSRMNWLEKLGWNNEQIDDLQYVGFAYIRQGKYEIALPIFEALCVLNPEDAYNPQTLGAIYLQLGQPNKALKCFDRALKLDADHSPTLLNLAKTFFMLGRTDEGLKLANILKNEPNVSVSSTAKALILAYS